MTPQLHSPRMAPARRRTSPLARLLALSAVVAAALIVAGCGGGDSTRDLTGEEFSEGNLADFSFQLDNVQDLVDQEDCEGAIQKVDNLNGAVDDIDPAVDGGLKDDLKELLGRLSTQIGEQCQEPEETTSTTDEETAPTTTDETTTTETTTTETTTTEDTTTTPPPDEGDGGGTQTPTPGQGGTPPGQGGTPPGQTDPGGPSGGIAPRAPGGAR